MKTGRDLTRRRFACLALPLVALPWLPGVVLAAGAEEAPDPLPFEEIAPGVFVHRGAIDLMRASNEGAIANLGFVVGAKGVAVIDSGGSVAEGRRILAAIRAVTDRPILYVLNTHMHPDHVFGNAAFAASGAVFVGHRNLAAALDARRASYLASNRELMGALMDEVVLLAPTLAVEREVSLDLGDRRLIVKAWPTAHTNNDLTLLDEATGTLFCGDLVFLDHCPTLDGSVLGWQKVLDALAALPAARVVPGHGPASAPWPDAIEPTRRYLDALVTDLRKAVAEGVPLSEAAQTAAASEAARWQLFEDYNTRNATAAFAELEWE
ncbi:MBL fold metallo-hydrolase [Aurantimonas sp. Leaf443]|nr:MBL fold metallo-hydrolase [Aurantimonas sp. Leaf443]